MMRFFIILSIMINISHASGEKYFIQFGSFKNIQGLEKSISKLPNSLRSHVVIVRSNSWYIPFAYYTSNKSLLYSKLPSYKHYFPDARIAYSAYLLKHPVVHNYSTKKRVVQRVIHKEPVHYVYPKRVMVPKPQYQNVAISESYPISQVIPKKVKEVEDVFKNEKPIYYKHFSKKMLSGKHYYLAYKTDDEKPNLLIKVVFGNHDVTYQPVIGEMKMMNANYIIENNRLYMFTDSFTQNGAFSKLEEHRKNHFLVSSWSNGKKLNTLRYYYKLNEAKKYLDIDTSNGLATALEEGNYDDFFLEEEDY